MEYTQAACRRRRLGWAVRAAIAGTGVLALVGIASPAAADVVVTPTEGVQDGGADLTFQISNDSPTASITSIEVQLPMDTPIAEVYPLSVADWAPAMTDVQVDKPVESLHGYQITTVTSAIKWIAMPGKALPPGGKTELFISIGPLPKVDKLPLAFVITNSDGTQERWTAKPGADAAPGERAAPVLVLKAAPAGQQDAHGADHGGAAGSDAAAAGDTAGDTAANDSTPQGQSSIGPWVLITLLVIVAISVFSLVLQRRRSSDRPAEVAEPSDADTAEPDAAEPDAAESDAAESDAAEPDEDRPKIRKRVAAARSGPAP